MKVIGMMEIKNDDKEDKENNSIKEDYKGYDNDNEKRGENKSEK